MAMVQVMTPAAWAQILVHQQQVQNCATSQEQACKIELDCMQLCSQAKELMLLQLFSPIARQGIMCHFTGHHQQPLLATICHVTPHPSTPLH